MKHVKYMSYVIRHRWYVMAECWKRGLFWRGLIHDWSKFLPSEWCPYAEYFYGNKKSTEFFDMQCKYGIAELAPWGASVLDHFDFAWLHHQHFNDHHWQWWILREDDGSMKTLPMSQDARTEMLCDWIGAGKAQGKPDTARWYLENRLKMLLHPTTRQWIEEELGSGLL